MKIQFINYYYPIFVTVSVLPESGSSNAWKEPSTITSWSAPPATMFDSVNFIRGRLKTYRPVDVLPIVKTSDAVSLLMYLL